jgi:hypothetical protein
MTSQIIINLLGFKPDSKVQVHVAYLKYLKYKSVFYFSTGITVEEYDAAVAENRELEFVCMRCRHNTVDNNGDITVNYSELEEPEEPSESAVAYGDLEMPEAPTESTASFASSILEEEALSFDITRPERQINCTLITILLN